MKYILKNIPLPVLITIILAIISYTWAVANAYNKVLTVEEKQSRLNNLPEDVASIKATLSAQSEDIKFIKNYIVSP